MATGVYILQSDITKAIAIPFFNGTSGTQIDPQVYYDYADNVVINVCTRLGITPDEIKLTSTGHIADINLLDYALNKMYVRLFSDKSRTINQDDYTQDKYALAIDECERYANSVYSSITEDTVTGEASTNPDSMIRVYNMRRAS